MARRYVIIGNGIAGHSAALAIRAADREGEIRILAREAWPTYSRILLSHYLIEAETETRIFLTSQDELERARIQVHYSLAVQRVDPAARLAVAAGGAEFSYDRLLIASGTDPVRPAIPGADLDGIFTLRTLDDARRIAAAVRPGGSAVILGAGLISLKAAEGLLVRGMRVVLIVSSGQILSTLLDPESAGLVETHLRRAGLAIRFGSDLEAYTGAGGKLTGAVLRDAGEIPADLVVIGKGVRCNLTFLAGTSLEGGSALAVDSHLETGIPGIFAAGDVANAHDLARGAHGINAIWPLAAAQGRVAGQNMTGLARTYPGGLGMNSFQLFGLPVVSMGVVAGEACTLSRGGFHRKLVFRGEALAGMVTIGRPEAAGVFNWLIRRGTPCRERAAEMLQPGFGYGSLVTLGFKDGPDQPFAIVDGMREERSNHCMASTW